MIFTRILQEEHHIDPHGVISVVSFHAIRKRATGDANLEDSLTMLIDFIVSEKTVETFIGCIYLGKLF